jgi:hypothetical protein
MMTCGLVRSLVAGCVALVMFSLGGCSVYMSGFDYAPRPAAIGVTSSDPAEAQPAETLVTVVGVRHNDDKEKIPPSVEVRLRIESTSPQPVSFDPASLHLTNGLLQVFGPPLVRPPGPMNIPQGQSATVTAYFPFPVPQGSEHLDLQSLRLSWALRIANQEVPQAATFQLQQPVYYYYDDPFYYRPYYGYGYYGYGSGWHGHGGYRPPPPVAPVRPAPVQPPAQH